MCGNGNIMYYITTLQPTFTDINQEEEHCRLIKVAFNILEHQLCCKDYNNILYIRPVFNFII